MHTYESHLRPDGTMFPPVTPDPPAPPGYEPPPELEPVPVEPSETDPEAAPSNGSAPRRPEPAD